MILIEFVSKINLSERLRRPPLLKRRGLNLKIDFRGISKHKVDITPEFMLYYNIYAEIFQSKNRRKNNAFKYTGRK